MSKKTRDSLDYHVFDEKWPLGSNPLGIIIGGTGSGKSYLTYNLLVPIYIKDFGITDILICNKTGCLDHTLQAAIKKYKKLNADVNVKFITPTQAYQEAQLIRCESLLQKMIKGFLKADTVRKCERQIKIWQDIIKSLTSYPIIHDGVMDYFKKFEEKCNFKLYEFIDEGGLIDNDEININETIDDVIIGECHKYARDLLQKQTEKIGDERSIIMIMDDQAGGPEMRLEKSDFTNLMLVRRHLFLGCFILTQSVISVNTTLRRQATVYFLLPGISSSDINLIGLRLTASCDRKELMDLYKKITNNKDRNEQIIAIFNVHPFLMALGRSSCPKLKDFK